MTRVLLAEDSTTVRRLLAEILETDPGVRVVAEAANGAEAIELTERIGPDVIVMDVYMPEVNGLEATREIMVRAPTPIVVVSSHLRDEIDLSLSATRAGALMVLPKPVPDADDYEEACGELIRMVKAMAGVLVVRRWPDPPPTSDRASPGRADAPPPARVIAIAASTGGPAALHRLLAELPLDFGAPVLVVQHIARGFVEPFADWLARGCKLHVKVASDREPLRPGVVFIAPDDRHLGVTPGKRVALSTRPPVQGFRPSATYLFESVADVFGAEATAVVLTGMGRDGVEGLRALRGAGGRVLAQDETSAIVHGMAGEAIANGVVDEVLALERLGSTLTERVGRADA